MLVLGSRVDQTWSWLYEAHSPAVEESDHTVNFHSKVLMISSARAVGRVRENFPEKVILKLKSEAGVIRQTGGGDRTPDRGKHEA